MKAAIKLLLCLLLCCSASLALEPSKALENNKVRRASVEKIQKYLSDKDFIYESDYTEKTSLWDIIKQWIYRKLYSPLFINHSLTISDIIEYAVAIAALALIIYFFSKSDKIGLFYKKSKHASLNPYSVEEDINQMNFIALIENAIAKGQYRTATRYLYLKLLKDLTDRQLITWKPEKTNRDYSNELRSSAFSNQFNKVTLLFDYTWYGDSPINENAFKNIKQSFEQFNKQLHPHS